jgi:DNA-directed RNA polymerase subunit RPC12/RpoP
VKIVSVTCNHCGAPLEIGESTRFTTCGHCGSRLAVHETASARFTELVQEVAGGLETIRLQNELERVDREWGMEQAKLAVPAENGGSSPPSVIGGLFGLIVGGGFSIVWIVAVAKMGGPWFMVLFGVVFLVGIVLISLRSISNAGQLVQRRARYEGRRAALVRQLEESARHGRT